MPNALMNKGAVKSAPKAAAPSMGDDDRRWRAEEAMRTIMRAEEHKKDKGLMRDVKKMASEKVAQMKGLCGKGT